MDAPASTSVLDTLRTVEFRLGLKGYNVDEVDEYLEKCAVEAEALKEQMRQTNERLQAATQRLAQMEGQERRPEPEAAPAPAAEAPAPPPPPPTSTDDTLQRTLVLAQRFVEQTKRESEAEAAERVARAQQEARSIVEQAESRARQISEEGERRLREEVSRLESMRSQLAGDVDNLARHLESERGRLRESLTQMLEWVEEKIQPSTALSGVRPHGGAGGSGGAESSANGDRGDAFQARLGGTGQGPSGDSSTDRRG